MAHYTATQIFVYKTDYTPILDGTAKKFYKPAMTDGIKEAFQGKFNYVFVAVIDYRLSFPKCIMTVSRGTETVAYLRELALIDGRQNLADGLLHQSVNHSENIQKQLPAIRAH